MRAHFSKYLRRCLRYRFLTGNRGTAAIEFALVVPALAIIAVTVSDVSTAAVQTINMESGVRASIQYAMNGGSDMGVAQTIGLQSWESRPQDATLSTTQQCICGAAAGACGQICPDGSQPQTLITATGSGTIGGSVISFRRTVTQTVRVR
jgi:Flp pilus assembly protein TadG